MKACKTILVIVLLIATNVEATTIIRKAPKETICGCMDTYTRLSFEVENRILINIKVLNSSSNSICDEWNIKRLASSTMANHPDGIIGTGVVGYTAKDKTMNYEQCLKTDEVEFDPYWFVEKVSIDLKKINKDQGEGSRGQTPGRIKGSEGSRGQGSRGQGSRGQRIKGSDSLISL